MGWFDKEKKEEAIPKLPELPQLPELPKLNSEEETGSLPQLPSVPQSSFGEKFSQSMIKEAVTGEKEDEMDVDEEENEKDLPQMTHPIHKQRVKEIGESLPRRREIPEQFKEAAQKVSKEPIFIRIDKFEESLKIFEKTKERISEVEKMLKDIKRVREEEEEELQIWEEEIQNLKNQIEKVDQDIFSKIE